ncbi:hypothetical protein [Streptomyces chartreusis]|uniref:Uncharacterized protein n=1 Tax=Streptomyces chartreusis TaxID=1969 RepID=A0A7I0NT88_STRCX|nr:hypothetical protein [Streptomyces chartreusis]QKZ16281.1 hypothetical protein HUT05_02180 [Streptomyces chartreusis]
MFVEPAVVEVPFVVDWLRTVARPRSRAGAHRCADRQLFTGIAPRARKGKVELLSRWRFVTRSTCRDVAQCRAAVCHPDGLVGDCLEQFAVQEAGAGGEVGAAGQPLMALQSALGLRLRGTMAPPSTHPSGS